VSTPVSRPPEGTASIVWLASVACAALALGAAVTAPTPSAANDSSRWCTVWSLLERHSYAIDDCPWSTVDEIRLPAPADGGRFRSSKPAFLATIVAATLYPLRAVSGVPLVEEELRTVYFKLPLVLFNVVPFAIVLLLSGRLLARSTLDPWLRAYGFLAAAIGTQLIGFNQVLNNHTVAAYAAFFAVYHLLQIEEEAAPRARTYAACGIFAALAGCLELPALTLLVAAAVLVVRRSPRQALLAFLPAALPPIIVFVLAQRAAFGQTLPVYLQFGSAVYNYPGSYWTHPQGLDVLNVTPEPRVIYFLNMTVGHHGVLSLTPVLAFALLGLVQAVRAPGRRSPTALAVLVVSVAVTAFYVWNPKVRNYGGLTQGMRWLFWLFPLWLIYLPRASVLRGERAESWRPVAVAALVVSIISAAYALRAPWSAPWMISLG
jgi:hypothetical protein